MRTQILGYFALHGSYIYEWQFIFTNPMRPWLEMMVSSWCCFNAALKKCTVHSCTRVSVCKEAVLHTTLKTVMQRPNQIYANNLVGMVPCCSIFMLLGSVCSYKQSSSCKASVKTVYSSKNVPELYYHRVYPHKSRLVFFNTAEAGDQNQYSVEVLKESFPCQ